MPGREPYGMKIVTFEIYKCNGLMGEKILFISSKY